MIYLLASKDVTCLKGFLKYIIKEPFYARKSTFTKHTSDDKIDNLIFTVFPCVAFCTTPLFVL